MKKVLVLAPYDNIYPPMNGGMMRCFHLIYQLQKYYSVTVMSFQDNARFGMGTNEFPGIDNINWLKISEPVYRDLFSLLPSSKSNALRYRWLKKSLGEPANQVFLRFLPSIKNIFRRVNYDLVWIENLATLSLVGHIRKMHPKAHIIYDAHNVDSDIARVELQKGRISEKEYQLTFQAESSLLRTRSGRRLTDLVFACSQEDLLQLKKINGEQFRGHVLPNGVYINETDIGQRNTASGYDIIFCGTLNYPPNREGLIWFIKNIFPLILEESPQTQLLVVGKGQPGEELLQILKGESILCFGEVEKVSQYYRKAAVAIVPLLSGSGTRLKLLEAMGNRLAVVSTSKGAEGIEYARGENIIIADDPVAFAKFVSQLLRDRDLNKKIAGNGFGLVTEKYDWNIIGRQMKNILEEIFPC